MALIGLVLTPVLAGFAALALARRGDSARWAALAGLALAGVLLVLAVTGGAGEGRWIAEYRQPWAPDLGVSVILALDGLSVALTALAVGLGVVAVLASWREIRKRSGLFHACLCWTVAAAIGVFLSLDLLVFVFFFEAMLVPSFILIAVFGHEERESAGLKYLIFNGVGGLGLLAGVLATAALAPVFTFDAQVLADAGLPVTAQVWICLGFALAFLTKLPAVPFHAWLPDAHTQAPTAGSILLAGLLLKTGAYGLYRFPPMLFPDALEVLAPWGMGLGVLGALYGGLLACGQHDAKRLIAYTSVAHMGLVLVGICAGTRLALTGAAVEMVAHAFSASALFFLVGALQERTGTRDMRELGGLQHRAPRFAAAFTLFFAAALAMPGTANFIGEVLVIFGAFEVSLPIAALALAALVISVFYATRLLQGVVFGSEKPEGAIADLRLRELVPVSVLAVATLAVGLYPQPLIELLAPAVDAAHAARAP